MVILRLRGGCQQWCRHRYLCGGPGRTRSERSGWTPVRPRASISLPTSPPVRTSDSGVLARPAVPEAAVELVELADMPATARVARVSEMDHRLLDPRYSRPSAESTVPSRPDLPQHPRCPRWRPCPACADRRAAPAERSAVGQTEPPPHRRPRYTGEYAGTSVQRAPAERLEFPAYTFDGHFGKPIPSVPDDVWVPATPLPQAILG
jgi:hypothetical protein